MRNRRRFFVLGNRSLIRPDGWSGKLVFIFCGDIPNDGGAICALYLKKFDVDI